MDTGHGDCNAIPLPASYTQKIRYTLPVARVEFETVPFSLKSIPCPFIKQGQVKGKQTINLRLQKNNLVKMQPAREWSLPFIQ
jgi:hypothetical protein